ncbi:hypothetical protein TrVE_jg1108 [Triparma verrucosa]|uniref:Phosphoribosyl-AMP cyclohydrolase domain-containing protein n=1 Tax=Triparma verrucosa TaxID=1606542 RepID=A0A9W7FNQ7_9STRA|nr:hypothetical protein TrVE_jg1108 [Triparma verrucosa]
MPGPVPTPYASFSSPPPSTLKFLQCVGRVRLDLCTYSSESPLLAEIVTLLSEAATDSDKKTAKKNIKNATNKCREVVDGFQVDCSSCDVEISVSSSHVLSTSGLICSSFLDAGCSKIIVPIDEGYAALEASLLPPNRLIASLKSDTPPPSFGNLYNLTKTLTILTDSTPSSIDSALNILSTLGPTSKVDKIITVSDADAEAVRKWNEVKVQTCMNEATPKSIVEGYMSMAKTDRDDGLFTTVVTSRSGVALGLVYSSLESVVAAIECGRGVYYSRSRGGLWRKGDSSGNYQDLYRIDLDCDGDALRFMVGQRGENPAFCHLNTLTCWGEPVGVTHLEEVLVDRLRNAPEGSYTKRLFEDEELLRNKLVEEAQELSEAVEKRHIAEELADVLYFAMVRAVKGGVSIDDAVKVLDERSKKVTRRPGNDKKERIEAAKKILEGGK